jgi:hypothetical protein
MLVCPLLGRSCLSSVGLAEAWRNHPQHRARREEVFQPLVATPVATARRIVDDDGLIAQAALAHQHGELDLKV